MRRALLVAATLFVALNASAAGLQKYRDWDQSPQGYFMTSAEKKQWRALRSDEEAERFVASFLEKRGGAVFGANVQRHVAIVDQFFINHDLRGLATLRKLMILFGPPRRTSVTRPRSGGSIPVPPRVDVAGQLLPIGTAISPEFVEPLRPRPHYFYALTFLAEDVPAFDGKDHVVVLEVDALSGEDRLSKPRRVNAMIELVAVASIRNHAREAATPEGRDRRRE